jgi:hypothetical protein
MKGTLSANWLICVAVALALAGGGAPAFAAPATALRSSCETCHSEIAVQFGDSAHAHAGMACVSCHGGNPADPTTQAMSASAGFRGRPTRQQIPEFCGSCHSDRSKMAEYGLETHQLEDYKQSAHGKAWAQGDTNVAVCVDCHGQHRILPEKDPRSMVSRRNVALTCSRCHADAALMAKYGLPATAYRDYMSSVHAKVQSGAAPEASPSCATCHASHAALPPSQKDIPNVCGRCHTETRAALDAGPHRDPVARGAMSCASCHGYHAIGPATHGQLVSMCGTCHYRFSPQAKRGDDLYAALSGSAGGLDWARRSVDWLAQKGAFVQDLRGRLEEGKMGLLEGARDQHQLDPGVIDKDLVITNAVVDAVSGELRNFRASATARVIGLGVFWCYTGIMVLLLYWKRRQSVEEPA